MGQDSSPLRSRTRARPRAPVCRSAREPPTYVAAPLAMAQRHRQHQIDRALTHVTWMSEVCDSVGPRARTARLRGLGALKRGHDVGLVGEEQLPRAADERQVTVRIGIHLGVVLLHRGQHVTLAVHDAVRRGAAHDLVARVRARDGRSLVEHTRRLHVRADLAGGGVSDRHLLHLHGHGAGLLVEHVEADNRSNGRKVRQQHLRVDSVRTGKRELAVDTRGDVKLLLDRVRGVGASAEGTARRRRHALTHGTSEQAAQHLWCSAQQQKEQNSVRGIGQEGKKRDDESG